MAVSRRTAWISVLDNTVDLFDSDVHTSRISFDMLKVFVKNYYQNLTNFIFIIYIILFLYFYIFILYYFYILLNLTKFN